MPTYASNRSTTLRRSQWVAGLLAALVLQQTCLAAQAEPAAVELKLDQRRLAAIAGLPPAPGSAAEAADLAILEWLQRFRSPEIVATTWLLLDRDLNVFSSAVGTELGKATPMLSAGLHAFMAPVNSAYRGIKQQQGRIRPYIAHPALEPCLPRENTGSFPSGHAVWFRTTAELLADLLPERRERLRHVGLQGGANRVLCGVHYPSDVEAGQRLGADSALQIIASPQWQVFRRDPALQAELKRLRAVPAKALPPMLR